MSPLWIVCIAGLSALFASFYPNLLPNQDEIKQMALAMTNPAMVAMMGSVYGMDKLSQASMMAQECLVWFLVAVAVMNIFLVNRHTRDDEEAGRIEMLRAHPVGRVAGSLATIKFAFGVNLLISLFTALLLSILNIGGTTVSGVLSYGFAIGAVGFVFAALTLLAAQLFSTARGVNTFSFALLGVFYMVRAIGDVANNGLSYISPLGLGMSVEAFYADEFWPIVTLLIEGIVLTVAALAITAVRDLGAGVLPARPGRAHASVFLRNPFGFAWRISRGTTLGWSVGLFVLGASYGSICPSIGDFVSSNEMMQQILGANAKGTLLDNYVALIFVIMSLIVVVPVVLTAMRIHGEEKHGRLDQLFGRAVSRVRLFASFIVVLIVESIVMEFLLSFGLFAASNGVLSLDLLLKAGFSYLPAIWTMAGLTVLLVGLAPKLAPLVWAMFGYTFLIVYFGKLMDVPEWATRITPFGNIAQLPVQEFSATPLIVLTLVAAGLSALGIWRFRVRDIG